MAFSFRFEYISFGAAVCARLHKTEVVVTEILSRSVARMKLHALGGGGVGEINLIPSKSLCQAPYYD